ncbi:jg13019 [Pararge aegeria aegeria]|uniref:Jg13019 protein n=1 Tax=Pararge aegeria aegeria TaxID=348720 RepID=A0A8S4RPY2_9NEOP|nr:jg13019 [Pararge aegeria aegeria]
MFLSQTKVIHPRDLKRFIEMIQRRRYVTSDEDILDIPQSVEDLPEAEPIHPGHTLLRPSRGMLKSSVKFPQKDTGDTVVYGNLKNLGITFGNTNQRLLYSDFRKTDSILTYLLEKAIRKIQNKKHSTLHERIDFYFSFAHLQVIIEIDPTNLMQMANNHPFKEESEEQLDIENNASEALDGLNEGNEDIISLPATRRRYGPSKQSKFRDRELYSETDTSDSSSSGSSDYDRNPGNPYSVYKDKYKQNWMWNHFMDGNHMNVNPYAPQLNSLGPSGASLFFGRKWWYYNQDDFQPLS